MSKFFTVKDTSLILGYSTNTVYKLLKEGRIKSARGSAVQGRFRISKTALEDFLKAKLPDDPLAPLRADVPVMQNKKENAPQFASPNPLLVGENGSPSLTPRTPSYIQENHSPLSKNLTRGLVIIGLILIILDLFLSQNFSLLEQAVRLLIMGIIIVLTYQSGSLTSESN